MTELFIKLLNMSITSCWIIFAAILFRVILKNAPKNIRFILWALVGIRLVCPFSFKSIFSMIPTAEPIPQTIIQNPIPTISNVIQHVIIQPETALQPEKTFSAIEIIMTSLSFIWLIGIAVMGIYATVSYLKIRNKVRISIKIKDNIYFCDSISSPFILGLIKPKIYLPSTLSEDEKECVIEHEKAHLRRFDHIWKPLGFAILSVYWFNPIIWIAYILLCRDIELACDEKVIKKMNIDEKQKYSQALLTCSISRKTIAACPLAFGEVGVKNRIKAIINYKKPLFWVILIAVICCIAVGIFFATDPLSNGETENFTDKGNNLFYCQTNENGKRVLGLTLSLNTSDKTFSLCYPILSSLGVSGTYEQTDTKIICTSHDGNYKYCFNILINGLSFSDEIPFEHPQYMANTNLEYLRDGDKFCIESQEIHDYRCYSFNSTAVVPPTLRLYFDKEKDLRFEFCYSAFSSYLPTGTFKMSNEELVLQTDDGKYQYVFDIVGIDSLSFNAEKSSPLPNYKVSGNSNETKPPFEDGALFVCDMNSD